LSSYGLLEIGVERKVLTPFIINYAEETIDNETRVQFNFKIAEYYEEILRKSYNNQK